MGEFRGLSSSIFFQLVLSALIGASCGQQYFQEPEKIISESHAVGDNPGSYAFTYETEGGILQREQGSRKYAGTPDETQLIQGSVQYNAPDGTPISLSWTADEFGAQVSGTHIPTPPPIPPAIQRALDWIAKQPSTTEEPERPEPPKKQQQQQPQQRDFSSQNNIVKNQQPQFGIARNPNRRN